MPKRMRDENLLKISEMADRSITDSAIASILICYLLHRMEAPMESEMLYDIAVTVGIINFFTYQEPLHSLLDSKAILPMVNDSHDTLYKLSYLGEETAKKLRNIAAKSYRDDIVSAARRAMTRRKNQKDVKISCEPLEQGCRLHVTLNDRDLKLLELSLFTPDRQTAEQLGERILINPSALYHDVLKAVMREPDEPGDLSDS